MLKPRSLDLIHLNLPEAPCYNHAGFSQKHGKQEEAQTQELSLGRYMRPKMWKQTMARKYN